MFCYIYMNKLEQETAQVVSKNKQQQITSKLVSLKRYKNKKQYLSWISMLMLIQNMYIILITLTKTHEYVYYFYYTHQNTKMCIMNDP